ncbi:MAG: glycosyltransferase family 4 protein [bacterium]|nr:glycosyltransferase family 4 protein [bacterium]
MRIAHLAQTTIGGGLARAMETVARAQSRDHDVLLLDGRPAGVDSVGFARERHDARGNTHLRAWRAAIRRIAAFEPDAVFLHAGSPGELALPALLSSRRWPTTVVEHAPELYPLSSPLRDRWLFAMKRRPRHWVSVSERGARNLERLAGLAEGTIRVVRNGVDEPGDDAPPTASALQFDDDAPVVVAFGNPDEIKGFDTYGRIADQVAAQNPATRFVWVGAETERRDGSVHVLPRCDQVGWMLRRASLVLIPSRTEGLPLLLLEAWACSAPVVASRVGGIPEVVEHGANGRLVDPEDLPAWVACVVSLLADPAGRAALGVAGRERWASEFDSVAMARRYAELLP